MAKGSAGTLFACSECGWQSTKWAGRCGECQTWGSVAESGLPAVAGRSGRALLRGLPSVKPGAPAVPISRIDATGAAARPTGMDELDRVLGGGLVPGTVALLAGEPGVGKSTLLLEAGALAAERSVVLYVTGEEAGGPAKRRGRPALANHTDRHRSPAADTRPELRPPRDAPTPALSSQKIC